MVSPFNKANVFHLDHEHLLTMPQGKLVPNMLMEVLPGDTFRYNTDAFVRVEAMVGSPMTRMDLLQWYFYVPNRILMDDWESYITGGFDGDDSTVKPYMVAPQGGYAVGSLADYLGLQIGISGYKHSALPFRAYQKIVGDWFINENLMDFPAVSTASGLDTTTSLELATKCWEKDYFTSSLPSPQRGQAAYLPFATNAPVKAYTTSALDLNSSSVLNTGGVSGVNGVVYADANTNVAVDGKSAVFADLSTASAVSVNDMRLSFQIQRFLEKNMRGGARLVEWTLSHFGVRIPDARLQRSEFIGGSRSPVMITPVEQTSATDATSPQGNLAGRGSSAMRTRQMTKSFVEQGWLIGICCVIPRTLYSQGLPRMWTRETRYDEVLPVFAHLGEQAVLNKELYVQGNAEDDGVFGYQERNAEMRHIPSSVHGQFRPGQSLDFWTQCRQFSSLPKLSAEFVKSDPSKRIFAVTDESVDCIEAEFLHHVKAIRPLPKYGFPGLIDHD